MYLKVNIIVVVVDDVVAKRVAILVGVRSGRVRVRVCVWYIM